VRGFFLNYPGRRKKQIVENFITSKYNEGALPKSHSEVIF
jgi:hypothetical protein